MKITLWCFRKRLRGKVLNINLKESIVMRFWCEQPDYLAKPMTRKSCREREEREMREMTEKSVSEQAPPFSLVLRLACIKNVFPRLVFSSQRHYAFHLIYFYSRLIDSFSHEVDERNIGIESGHSQAIKTDKPNNCRIQISDAKCAL